MGYATTKVKMERYFETLDDINMTNIKLYYLTVLKNIMSGTWGAISLEFKNTRVKRILPNNGIDLKGNKIKKISSIGPGIQASSSSQGGTPLTRLSSEQIINNKTEIFNNLNKVNNNETITSNGDSAIYITTKDAYTLTDGPTIFLSNDVEKIAKFCIQQSNIPEKVMENIMEKVEL